MLALLLLLSLSGVDYVEAYKTKPWKAQITIDHLRVCLGYYASEKEAVKVYQRAAKDVGDEARKKRKPHSVKYRGK